MNSCDISFAGTCLTALPSGALWWHDERMLVVSDLHLGKSERLARRGGTLLPPYEVRETLERLDADLGRCAASLVICLGDSFDDMQAAEALPDEYRLWITRMQAGRRWIWIEGNHDSDPTNLGGTHLAELRAGPLTFRHIGQPGSIGEVSGHFHPKASLRIKGRAITRPCFLFDQNHLILPAYGTYTGGLRSRDPALAGLISTGAMAILTGPNPVKIPMPSA